MVVIKYDGMPYGNDTIRQAACCSRSVSRAGVNPRRTFYYEGQRHIFRLNQEYDVPEALANLLVDTEVYKDENGVERKGFSIV